MVYATRTIRSIQSELRTKTAIATVSMEFSYQLAHYDGLVEKYAQMLRVGLITLKEACGYILRGAK